MMLKVAAGKEWTRIAGEESLKVFSCRREQGPGRTLIRRAATADRWTSAEQSASSAAEQLGGGMAGRGGLWTEIIMISKAKMDESEVVTGYGGRGEARKGLAELGAGHDMAEHGKHGKHGTAWHGVGCSCGRPRVWKELHIVCVASRRACARWRDDDCSRMHRVHYSHSLTWAHASPEREMARERARQPQLRG